jgi:signal transduction histidine kinase
MLVLVCAALWAGAGAAVYGLQRAGLIAEFDKALEATALTLGPMTEYTGGKLEFDPGGDLMPSFEREDRPDYYQVLRPNGSVLARSRGLKKKALAPGAVTPGSWDLTLPDGLPGRALAVRFLPKIDEDDPGEGEIRREEVTLIVARHRDDLDASLHLLAVTLLLVGAATTGATGIVVALVVGRGLRPLSALARRAAAIDASSLQLRFPAEGLPAELAPIAQRLNDLLSRLEASFARERRFSADVAHELRTPIAELRTLAEVSLRWPQDENAARAALSDALAIALQMESIATHLMALTRCDAGQMPAEAAPVDLATVVEEVWEPFAAQASTKRLHVTMSVPAGATWTIDPGGLRTILSNLLSNAAEYSPVGGAIRLTAEAHDGTGRVIVSNTTTDLGRSDLPHLFDRFWRKDASRSSASHSGLGLSLAKAYADALGCALRADLTREDELTIELSRSVSAAS